MSHPSLYKFFLLSLMALLCSLQSGISFGASDQGEAKVKTAYIYNFSKYTTWPPSPNGAPLNICLLGAETLAKQLVALEGRQVQSRTISVKTLSPLQSTAKCEVLFIGNLQKEQLAKSLNGIATSPILTVSGRPGFAKQGGMIELIRQGTKIRFIINMESVNRAGLSISSRLLKLATIINGEQSR